VLVKQRGIKYIFFAMPVSMEIKIIIQSKQFYHLKQHYFKGSVAFLLSCNQQHLEINEKTP